MIHFMLVMADTLIVATLVGDVWNVTLSDLPTGITCDTKWNAEQMAAILALGLGSVGENEYPGYDSLKLYEVAKPAIEGLPSVCRPIP